MGVEAHAAAFELILEDASRRLTLEAGGDHGAAVQSPLPQVVNEFHGVDVVGDSEVGPHLAPLDVARVDAEEDVRTISELLEQAHLDVRVETREDPGGMIVVEQLASELEVELVVELVDPLEDRGGLLLQVQFIVEADFSSA